MTYADFETMKGDDPRFKALEKKEREALVNERYARRRFHSFRNYFQYTAILMAFHRLGLTILRAFVYGFEVTGRFSVVLPS